MKTSTKATKIVATILATGTALLTMAGPTHAMQVVEPSASESYIGKIIELDDLFDDSDDPCWACFMACGYACRAPGLYCGFEANCDSIGEECSCECTECRGNIIVPIA